MRALICGVGGQDGGYLAKLLLEKGYQVTGTSRDAPMNPFSNLRRLGVLQDVRVVSMAVNDFHSVLSVVQQCAPDEIYNLSGQTSVGLSFEQPVETMESIVGATLSMLEVIRFVNRSIRFYSAGSSEVFGDTTGTKADETTAFSPRSPYGVAKASSFWLVDNYRKSYGLFACTGILFNHESPLRPERFVTQKIVRAAARIAEGKQETLDLGNLGIRRDWGWAPEYVDAIWRIMQRDQPEDFVIATGRAESLEYFVAQAFAHFGLDWRQHTRVSAELFRPSDVSVTEGNPAKAELLLDWSATTDVDGVIRRMCEEARSSRA